MAEFRVHMMGLICHVGEDNDTVGQFKKHAAIIDEPKHHHARLCIRGTDLEVPGANVIYAIQQDDEITFPSLSQNDVAETEPVFRKAIPSLGFITDGGTLNNAVKGRKKHNEVLAYIVYPEGKLTISKMYRKTGRYVIVPGVALDAPHCIGEVVDFVAVTNDPVTVRISNPNRETPITHVVKADRKICIINNTNMANPHHHLDHHRKLTAAPQIARVVSTNTDCSFDGQLPDCFCPHPDGGPDAGDPECSNSQWP